MVKKTLLTFLVGAVLLASGGTVPGGGSGGGTPGGSDGQVQYNNAGAFGGISNISTTEVGYLDNASSNIQTQLNAKIASSLFTAPTSFTMNITGVSANPAKGSSPTVDKAWYTIINGVMTVTYNYVQSAQGTSGTGTYLFELPSGWEVNTTLHPAGGANLGRSGCGVAKAGNNTTGMGDSTNPGFVGVYDSTHLAMATYNDNTITDTFTPIGSTNWSLGFDASPINYYFTCTIPVTAS